MKRLIIAATLVIGLQVTPAVAQITDADTNGFDGVKVGATVDYRRHEVKRIAPGLTDRIDAQEGGAGLRVFGGYDKTFGNIGLIGVEAGVGRGGRSVKADVTGGTYRMRPSWLWDASARFGIMPTQSVLLDGRAGYAWTRTKEVVDFSAAAQQDVVRKKTDGGFLYGFGGEFAVAPGFSLRTEFDQTNFGKGFKAARIQLGGVARF
jgi:outer membrane immunogenic protein